MKWQSFLKKVSMCFGNGNMCPQSIFLFLSGNPYWVKSNLILPPILGLFFVFLALKGRRECRKILTEEEEIPPTRLLILVRKFVLVLSQQSYILSILLTKEYTSVCDFNYWYLLSISYKPNTSITCSSDHNSGEQVLLTTVYRWEKQRLNE